MIVLNFTVDAYSLLHIYMITQGDVVYYTFYKLHSTMKPWCGPCSALYEAATKRGKCQCTGRMHHNIIIINANIIIINTRPKPAYGRQGLAGSWGQGTDQASTFWGVLNVSLRACGLSSDLHQHGIMNYPQTHLEP